MKKNIGKIFTPNDNISWLDSLLFISLSMQRNIWDGWTIKSIGQWPYNNNIFIHFVHILKKKLMQRKVRDGGTLQPWDGWTISSNTGVWSWLQLLPTGETIFLNHRYMCFLQHWIVITSNLRQTNKLFLLSVIFMNVILIFISNVLNVFSLLGRPLFFKRLQTTMNHLLFPQETPMEVGLISYHVCGVNGICQMCIFRCQSETSRREKNAWRWWWEADKSQVWSQIWFEQLLENGNSIHLGENGDDSNCCFFQLLSVIGIILDYCTI